MELINGYYVGNVAEDGSSAVAVSQARFESDQSPAKQSPVYWMQQWEDMDEGSRHPLGGVVCGPRQSLIDATKGSSTLVNLTPHEIVVFTPETDADAKARFAPSGKVARLIEKREEAPLISGFRSCYIMYGDIADLPSPREGVLYIVSALVGPVASAMGRHDVLAPDTGKAIRENGVIIGVPGFVRY